MQYFILDLLSAEVNREILLSCSIFGYALFFIYFYGSKSWTDFSEIDKVGISLVFGFITFYFLLLPLYTLLTAFSNIINFTSEDMIMNPVADVSLYRTGFFLLIGYLIAYRKKAKVALIESKKLHIRINNGILILLLLILVVMALSEIISLAATHYSVYLMHFAYVCLSCSLPIIFLLFINIAIFFEENEKVHSLVILEKLNISSRLKFFVVALILLSFIGIGTASLIPSVDEEDWKTVIVVDEFPVEHNLSRISADKIVYRHYTINHPLALDWVRVETEYNVVSASKGGFNRKTTDYYVNDNYFIINEINETKVSVVMTDEICMDNVVSLDAEIPEYKNETCYAKIHLVNNLPVTLQIQDFSFDLHDNYKPVKVVVNYNRSGELKSYSWTENNTERDIVTVKGSDLLIRCYDLDEVNDSVDVYAVLKLK
nr:hypothetical protein [uncultured Methanolobus sp.]